MLFSLACRLGQANIILDITTLKLISVVLVICHLVFGSKLINKKVLFHNDNQALILKRQTSKSQRVMSLLRPFIINCMLNNIVFRAVHIPTPTNHNAIADSISRKKQQLFRQAAPHAKTKPSPVPSSFQHFVCNRNLNLLSHHSQILWLSLQHTFQLRAYLTQQCDLTYQANIALQNFKVSKTKQTNFSYLSYCKV